MSVTSIPSEIFNRAATEGERHLDQSLSELIAMSSIAGVALVIGIVELSMRFVQSYSMKNDTSRRPFSIGEQ